VENGVKTVLKHEEQDRKGKRTQIKRQVFNGGFENGKQRRKTGGKQMKKRKEWVWVPRV